MKILVTYGSEYGSTEQYARWLGEELGAEVCSSRTVRPEQLSQCDVIIHGGGLYVGAVKGLEVISENAKLLSGKRIAIFTVGMMDPSNTANMDSIKEGIAKKLTAEQLDRTTIFNLKGDINYNKMNTLHRMMMWGLRKALSKKSVSEQSKDDKAIISRQNLHGTDRAALLPIVAWARE